MKRTVASATRPSAAQAQLRAREDPQGSQTTDFASQSFASFFTGPQDYLVVPVPLPHDRSSASNDMYFADSYTLDQIAIIDACLHNGYNVAREHSIAMQQLGAVLEGTRNVYWRLTAWENLMYFGRLRGYYGKKLAIRAEQILRELDLWDRRKDLVRTFSRGMQQKVAIACSLITDPPIVLLDEPTLGLDIQASRTVKEWITLLAREQNKTVVLTTHQLDQPVRDVARDRFDDLVDAVALAKRHPAVTRIL